MSGPCGPLFAIAWLALGVTSAYAQNTGSTERASVRIGAGAGQLIHLDGQLREALWQTVDSIAPLTQVEPTQGAAPSARTVVRVVATGDAIVFGIQADNPPGVGLVAFARQRDAVLDNEDHIKIVLDTYLDGRSGYVFAVNPYGARYDALVASQGEGEDANWDAVWEGRRHAPRAAGRRRFGFRSRVFSSDGGCRGGIQRPAPHSAPAGDRQVGESRAQLPGDPRRAGRSAHRPSGLRARY